MIKQTDISNRHIRRYGCLMMSLVYLTHKITGLDYSEDEVIWIYNHLLHNGQIDADCYVKNHDSVIQVAGLVKDIDRVPLRYVGATYLDGRTNWGQQSGRFIILQMHTLRDNGHFRALDYDPYYPQPRTDRIMSIRYYD